MRREKQAGTGRPAFFIVLVLALLLSGCGHFSDTVPLAPEHSAYELYGSRRVGQAFVCHHAGLDGISVMLDSQPGAGEIVLHLRDSAGSDEDIARVTVPPGNGGEAAYHYFRLPLQDNVNGRSFYLLLESPGSEAADGIVLPYSPGGASREVLFLDGVPSSGSLSFKLHYSVLYIAKDLGRQAVSYGLRVLWLLFLSALLFLLPGGAVLAWLLREGDWVERTVVALGMSVAVYALLMYVTMTGLRLGPAATIGFLALCAVLIGVRWWLDRRLDRPRIPGVRELWASIRLDPSPVALAFVFALGLGVRIFIVRDLVAPMWGDGYQHTMIAQLMVDNGGLFDSWEPYAPLKTFTYHFGFHANVALFHWLSGVTVIRSAIWVGQILNALAVLALYPIARKVCGGNRWAGVGAVLVAGLLSPMPMYYVNWGRYTQLAGQVILPALMWLTWTIIEQTCWDWKRMALTAAAIAALGITHYRVVLLYAVFVLACWLVNLLWGGVRWKSFARVALRLSLLGGLALVILMPWAQNVFRARIPELGQHLLESGSENEFQRQQHSAIGDVSLFVPWGLLISSLGALVWRSLKGRFEGWVTVLWVGGLLVLANPYRFRLPGTGIVDNFAVSIALYIPVGVLVGALAGELFALLRRWRRWGTALWAVLALSCAGWGMVQRARDLKPEQVLLSTADMAAMSWIRENTPPDSRFLVNGFLAYGGTLAAGADAGWWIPLMTGRESTLPPLLCGTEVPVQPDDCQKPIEIVSRLRAEPPASRAGAAVLRSEGVTHVYIGEGNGMVGNPDEPLLDVDRLLESPYYRSLYHQAGVWVFELAIE